MSGLFSTIENFYNDCNLTESLYNTREGFETIENIDKKKNQASSQKPDKQNNTTKLDNILTEIQGLRNNLREYQSKNQPINVEPAAEAPANESVEPIPDVPAAEGPVEPDAEAPNATELINNSVNDSPNATELIDESAAEAQMGANNVQGDEAPANDLISGEDTTNEPINDEEDDSNNGTDTAITTDNTDTFEDIQEEFTNFTYGNKWNMILKACLIFAIFVLMRQNCYLNLFQRYVKPYIKNRTISELVYNSIIFVLIFVILIV
jgi:hypothetical protein